MLLLVMGALSGAWGCLHLLHHLNPPEGRTSSFVMTDTADTRLGKASQGLVKAHAGKSGVFPLVNGRDAFAARALLADAAERTLDIQYYIWHDDLSGGLLFAALRRAADRGVRVRLLLDDNNTPGLDGILAELNAHPNIEVRLFNPFKFRRWRIFGYLADFGRLNRRMHNKSFTADNQATIIGGRNVADEYFAATKGTVFVDLDVLAIGPVVHDVSRDFDRYWASQSSYPAENLLPASKPAKAAVAASALARPGAGPYLRAVSELPLVRNLLDQTLPFEWAVTQMVSDDPAKGLGLAPDSSLLWARLREITGMPKDEWNLISPYFVPMAGGVDALSGLARRGVKIRVLTNSLEATDVAAVHAGYAKRRKALLHGGVELFESKRGSATSSVRSQALAGSSGSSLHAKTFGMDRSRVFIGSFNFDPRSARLNTELGFVIDSPVLAKRFADTLAPYLSENAYRVGLSAAGSLQWVERVDGKEIIYDREPHTRWWRRAAVAVLSWLPIEWLL